VTGQRNVIFLLFGVLGLIGAALAGAVLTGLVLNFGAMLLRAKLGFPHLPEPSALLNLLIVACGFQLSLLLGALWQGRRLGQGDRSAGLGIGPIRRKPVIACLCLVLLGWLVALVLLVPFFPSLGEFAKSSSAESLLKIGDSGLGLMLLSFVLVAVLAPLSEELFFRGWFWEALRRRGYGAGLIAAATAAPWLLLHGLDAPGRILFLIPAAVILSLARHVGGGVRASLVVHMVNNTAATLTEMVSVLFR
jgi:membrane protease YdiL (CAAX protease family)